MKDDSARDKAIEKLVSEKLRKGTVPSGAACPDAEILAAYVERALTPRERASWETHFDACARCQMQIAELVRLGEADQAEAPALSPAPARSTFGLRWAWAAPMLVALLVAGLWYTGEFKHQLKQTSEIGAQRSSPPPSPAKAPETSEVESKKKEVAAASRPERQLQDQKSAARTNLLRNQTAQNETASSVGRVIEGQPRGAPEATASSEDTGGRENRVAAAPVPPVAAQAALQPAPAESADKLAKSSEGAIAPPSERARLQELAAGENSQTKSAGGTAGAAPSSREEPSAIKADIPAADQARRKSDAGVMEAGNALTQVQGLRKARAEAEFHFTRAPSRMDNDLITSPAYLWRVGQHGLIQKEGLEEKWETKPSGVRVDLLDVTFPGSEVGWVVGQAGTVLRSTDGGETWQKVSSPTGDDLVRVTASSDQSAQVTAHTGRIYSTTDGGANWRPVSSPK